MLSCLSRPIRKPDPAARLDPEHNQTNHHHQPPCAEIGGTNLGVGVVGGSGGTAFDDRIYNRVVTGVSAWWDRGYIYGVRFEYDGLLGQLWGSTAAYSARWTAPSGTNVKWVLVHADNLVRGFQLWTEDGNQSNFFGYVIGPRTDLQGDSGEVLVGVAGRRGAYLDNLQLTFGPRPARVPQILWGSSVGGNGGDYFLDNMSGPMGTITGFKIRSGGAIDNICVQYGGVYGTPRGGLGGSEMTWLVPAGEYVSQVVAYSNGSVVVSLQFFTNRNNRSPVFGTVDGQRSQFQGTAACPALSVVGGRASVLVDNLFFGFSQVQADRYVIRDVVYDMPSIQTGEVLVLASAKADNDTDSEQQTTLTMSYQLTETASWSETNSATVGFAVTIETQAGAVFAKTTTSVTLSSSWTGSWTTNSERSETTLIQLDETITVPARKSVTGQLLATKVAATCAWRGKKYAVVNDQVQTSQYQEVQGTFTAKTACQFNVRWLQN